jgi:hypothetical protein
LPILPDQVGQVILNSFQAVYYEISSQAGDDAHSGLLVLNVKYGKNKSQALARHAQLD